MHHRLTNPGVMICGAMLLAAASATAEDLDSSAPIDEELAAVSRMLDAAWSGDAQAAAEIHDSLKARVKDKPRWHYAYGVSSLKLKRYPDAIKAFEAAVKNSEAFDLAAWKGLIWTELTHKRYDDALTRLEQLAAIVSADDFGGGDEDRDHAATWIGQAVVAVEKTVTTPKVQKRLAEANERLSELWPEELAEGYQSGRDYALARYDDLMSDVKQTSDKLTAKEIQSREDKQKSLEEGVTDADKKRDELKKSAEELQKQAEKKSLQIDKQLARLERDYNILETRANSVLQSMSYLQNQAQLLRQQRRNSQTQSVNGQLNDLQRVDMQLAMYQQEYEATLFRGGMIVQQAMQGAQLKQQLEQGLQEAAGELGARDASLKKWSDRLTKSGEKLQNSKIKVASPTLRQKRQQAKSLNTYLEFDPEWERIRLTERAEESQDS